MRKNSQLEVVLAELAAAGITPRISNGGKHIRVRWEGPSGGSRLCTISGTCSDRRGLINARAVVRRLLRRDATPIGGNIRHKQGELP